jgi:hypothetical protein
MSAAKDFGPRSKARIERKEAEERVRGISAWRRGVDRTLGLVEPEPVAARAA